MSKVGEINVKTGDKMMAKLPKRRVRMAENWSHDSKSVKDILSAKNKSLGGRKWSLGGRKWSVSGRKWELSQQMTACGSRKQLKMGIITAETYFYPFLLIFCKIRILNIVVVGSVHGGPLHHKLSFIDLKATLGTYELRSYGSKQ